MDTFDLQLNNIKSCSTLMYSMYVYVVRMYELLEGMYTVLGRYNEINE